MNSKASSHVLYGGLVFAVSLAMVAVHREAGFTFPVPWPDEAVFVSQADAFARSNSLVTPYLNEIRPILWMPPGYMILLGLVFKVFGSGLAIARSVSLALMITGLGAIAWTLRRQSSRFLLMGIAGLIFLSHAAVLTANIARMESLLVLGCLAAMMLLAEENHLRGMALLLALPLVHPNAVYLLCAGIGFFGVQRLVWNQKASRPGTLDLVILASVLLLLGAALVLAVQHWSDFTRDLAYQFARKGRRNLAAPFLTWSALAVIVPELITLAAAVAMRNRNALLMACFSLGFWLVNRIGQEMWYEVFDALALFCLSAAVIMLFAGSRKIGIAAIVALAAVLAGSQMGVIDRLRAYPESMHWYGMRFQSQVAYFTRDDARRLSEFVQAHRRSDGPLKTKIYPSGDALLLRELEGSALRSIYVPQDTVLFPPQTHDLFLVHISRYSPIGWDYSFLPWVLEEARLDTTDRRSVIFERDGTEAWYFRFASGGDEAPTKPRNDARAQHGTTYRAPE